MFAVPRYGSVKTNALVGVLNLPVLVPPLYLEIRALFRETLDYGLMNIFIGCCSSGDCLDYGSVDDVTKIVALDVVGNLVKE